MQQALRDQVSPLTALGQITLKLIHVLELLRDDRADGDSEVERREAENGDLPVHLWKVDQKGVIDDGNFNGLFDSPDGEKKELSGELLEENQRIKQLTRQMTSLPTEEASLQFENSWFESEILKLQLKLQLCLNYMKNVSCNLRKKITWGANTLLRNWEETSQSEQEPEVHLSDLHLLQEDGWRLGESWREHCLPSRGILLCEKSSGKHMGALSTEGKLHELRKEDAHLRQRWLKSSPCSSLSQAGLLLLLLHPQPPEAWKSRGSPRSPGPPGGGYHTGRALRPGVTCRFDSAWRWPGPGHPQPQEICLCFLLSGHFDFSLFSLVPLFD